MPALERVTQAARITPEDAENLLIDLVNCASPSHHEGDAVRYLVEWLAAHGADHAYVDEVGNAVGVIGSGSRTAILLGHIDTFGGSFPVRLEDRRLYGRGSVDAKGSLCAFAAAALNARIPDDWRVIVIGAVEEEARSSKGAHYAARTYQPDLCIIGEPSAWDRITLGYKGRLLIDWRWHGGLAHSAGTAASPAEHAFAYWERVRAYTDSLNQGRNGIFNRVDATLHGVNTGNDGVYGWADVTIGFRLPPDVTPQAVADALHDSHEVSVYGMEHAYVADRDSQLSRIMRGAIRAHGGQPAFVYKTGTSDMNVVGRVWNCPILAYGPGDSALDHTPDEHLDLDEYGRAVGVLTTALERLKD
ncbi:MAG: [LysW]-lysine hydrolase [Anaerolinea sp.]|nr:[LysW]-lysine hydrolase [Anaerolinea sp.]